LLKTHLFADCVSDLVKIVRSEKCFAREFSQPLFVLDVVMQREHRLHVLPLAMFGGDSCTAVLSRTADHMVDVPMPLSHSQGLGGEHGGNIAIRLHLPDPMQPVFDSRSVYHICQDLLIRSLDKHQQGGFVAASNFGGQPGLGECSNELLELFRTAFFVCARLVPRIDDKFPVGSYHLLACGS
jgi:hypothetical protein